MLAVLKLVCRNIGNVETASAGLSANYGVQRPKPANADADGHPNMDAFTDSYDDSVDHTDAHFHTERDADTNAYFHADDHADEYASADPEQYAHADRGLCGLSELGDRFAAE